MSPRTHQLLSEKSIYVSWGLLGLAVASTWMVASTYFKIEKISADLLEVPNLQRDITYLKEKTREIEKQLGWLNSEYQTQFK